MKEYDFVTEGFIMLLRLLLHPKHVELDMRKTRERAPTALGPMRNRSAECNDMAMPLARPILLKALRASNLKFLSLDYYIGHRVVQGF